MLDAAFRELSFWHLGELGRRTAPYLLVSHHTLQTRASHIEWRLVELIVLIVVVVVVLLVLTRGGRYLGQLIVNGIIGVVLLFLTNLVLGDEIPINVLTILICAIGGVIGWLIILVLHLLGVAFYVPA
jgi:hypothetical protein